MLIDSLKEFEGTTVSHDRTFLRGRSVRLELGERHRLAAARLHRQLHQYVDRTSHEGA
jgi:hypothetical protein